LYLQPWPDIQPDDPQERAVARETIELAFIVAVQHLPARQRAVLILRDVLGWPAQQTADTLELTLASANSALQRARVTMREHLPEGRLDWSTKAGQGLTEDERRLVAAYVRANESLDIDGLGALLREDLRFAMPPQAGSGSVGTKPSRAGWTAASAGATTPTGSAEPRWPTASRQWRCTCDAPGLRSTKPSRWTCCASRTA
jgi:hypothetical protein